MYRHTKTCTKKKKENTDDVATLKQEIKHLRNKIEQIEQRSLTSSVAIQNAQVINNINIHIKNFGFETLNHIPQEYLNRCFVNKKIVDLIENIHLDTECPENKNVRLKSKKQELMEVFEYGAWKIKDQDETLTELIHNGYRILRRHGKNNKEEIMDEEDIDEDEYHGIVRWLEQVYEDKKLQKPLKRDLIIRFLNNQAYLLAR